MKAFTPELTSDFSQNPLLLYMLTKQENETTELVDLNESLNKIYPPHLFSRVGLDKVNYHPLSYIASISIEQQKEEEWVRLVGIEFYSLPQEKRNFLLKTAGIFDFGEGIDIKKVYKTSIY